MPSLVQVLLLLLPITSSVLGSPLIQDDALPKKPKQIHPSTSVCYTAVGDKKNTLHYTRWFTTTTSCKVSTTLTSTSKSHGHDIVMFCALIFLF